MPSHDPGHDPDPAAAPGPGPSGESLAAVLEAHAAWLASDGRRGRRADLTDAHLEGADLAGCNLVRATLVGADLTGADLSGAVLDRARMTRVRLGGADLLGASLVESDLTWADLAKARMAAANCAGACLADADLTGALLKGTDFTNADLEGADLRGANLDGAVMNGTDLTAAHFDPTPARGATDARMDQAYEADDVLEGHDEPVAVSELPDADLEYLEAEPDEPAAHVGSEAWVGTPPLPGPPPAAPAPAPRAPVYATYPDRARALAAVLDAHARWLASGGTRGERARLDGFDLDGLSLRDADLRRADLGRVVNLSPGALAGADLDGAVLPEAVARFPGLERVAELARRARRQFVLLLSACLYTALAIAAGAGRPLAAGTAELRLPLAGVPVPVLWFYLGAPLLVLALYLWLQVYLQRMWEALGRLPARFPDGRALDEACDPWLPAGAARAHRVRLRGRRPPLFALQRVLAAALVWGAAPATLAFLWGAFLPRVGLWESGFHALLAAAAFGFGVHAHLLARRTLRGG